MSERSPESTTSFVPNTPCYRPSIGYRWCPYCARLMKPEGYGRHRRRCEQRAAVRAAQAMVTA